MTAEATNVQPADPAVLAKLDYIVLIDHSGSMSEPSSRIAGKTRWEEIQETATAIAREAQKYDDDGICAITFAGSFRTFNGVTADKVKDVFRETAPRGSTTLGPALLEAIKLATASAKETVVIVHTDGAANDPDAVIAAINKAGKELNRPKIGFVFVQVGNDPDAARFLDKLDNELSVDVVATVREDQAEELGLAELVTLARTA